MTRSTVTLDALAREMRARLDAMGEQIPDDAAVEAKIRQIMSASTGDDPPRRKVRFGREGDPSLSAAEALAEGHFNPYMVERAGFREMDAALREGRSHRYQQPLMATVTTGDLGERTGWGENVPGRVRMLHMVAGVPRQGLDARQGEYPKFTLPTATAGAGEGSSLTEFDSADAGTVTLARYGRFSDLTTEGLVGASALGLTKMHMLGIAKDLDKVLIDKVETDAGTAVTFASGVPASIRKQMAVVQDATQCDPEDLTILAHPDDVALLEDVTPASGSDVGEGFVRFSGALVYVSGAVNTGFMTIANLRFGCRYFAAGGTSLTTDEDIKTGIRTYASYVLAGFGTGLVSGYAKMQDVVTG